MVKQKESALSNTKIAIFFFVFLAFVVVISLTFKIVGIIRDGQFDSSRRFNLAITNGQDTKVMSFSNYKDVAIFELDNNMKPLEAGRFLEVPIDGFIDSNSLNLDQKADSLFFKSILSYNGLKTNLTIIDLLKLLTFTTGASESNITTKTISQDEDGTELDKIVSRLVTDELMERDNQTIQIINGTDIGGLGNRLARLITNMGGDVIIVATSDVVRKKSEISYIDKKTYTVERLEKVLGYEVVKEANAISDVTIIIGEDKVNNSPF